jgi:uncharacterized protein involved in exopolysaccharide biosynthesis
MEEEIDLRRYIEVLLGHWIWIVGLAVVAAIAGFVLSSLQPPTYQASSVVMVTEPRFQLQFDSRFQTDEGSPAYKAFPVLAVSDDVLQSVLDAYQATATGRTDPLTLGQLADMTEASSEGDPSLVVLTVQSNSAETASLLANLWADVFTGHGNALYSGGQSDVDFFQEQMAQAANALQEAEETLIEFEAGNRESILQNQLGSLQQAQRDYLASQRAISTLVQDVQALRAQLAERPSSQETSLADGLTALFLQLKAFNAQTEMPLQLSIDSASVLGQSVTQQMAYLDDLAATLQQKSIEIGQKLEALEPEILDLQRQIQQISVEKDRLTRGRDLARETHLTLARKLEEAQISAQEANGVLHVGSYASVPSRAIGPRTMFNAALAGLVGLMLGVVGVLAVDFWRQGNGQQHPAGEE